MEKVDQYAKIIWDYMLMHQKLEKADVIFVLGSGDVRSAERAAEIYKEGYAPLIVCSGGNGKGSDFTEPEANIFSRRIIEFGVPTEAVLLEPNSISTGDNIIFTKKLLETKNIFVKKIIPVSKPYVERRMFTAIRKQWPKVECIVASPQISYENYGLNPKFREKFLSTMVGDLIRIKEYPKLGFQIEQDIPEDVWSAGQELIKLGYNKPLV